MSQQESNNDFFSYQGTISRKNYIINMLILLAIFIGCSFVRLENFKQFITYEILYNILVFMLSMVKFVSIMAILSVIYRRISDFAEAKRTAEYYLSKYQDNAFIAEYQLRLIEAKDDKCHSLNEI